METSTSSLQVSVNKISDSEAETNAMIAEVQSKLGSVYSECSGRVVTIENKVAKIDKTVKGYIDVRINEVCRLVNKNPCVPCSIVAGESVDTLEGVRKEVIKLQQKNRTDELIIKGLRDLVIDVKEQLDITLDDK